MREQIIETLNQVRQGNKNALEAYIFLKEIEGVLSEALKELNDEAVDEAVKYEKKSFTLLNAKIEVKNNAGRWDYSHIELWNLEKAKIKLIEDKAKAAYEAKKKGLFLATEEESEIVDAAKFTEGKLNIAVKIVDNQIKEKLPFE